MFFNQGGLGGKAFKFHFKTFSIKLIRMEKGQKKRRQPADDGKTADARGRFGSYKPEEERFARPPVISRPNGKVQRMLKVFERVSKACATIEDRIDVNMISEPLTFYAMFLLEANNFSYSGGDIQDFLYSLRFGRGGPPDEEAHFALVGLCVSALTGIGKEKNYSLQLGHFDRRIPFLGFNTNGKDVEISGDADFSIGKHYRHGRMVLHGDCHECDIGEDMVAGEIVIDGNVGMGDQDANSCIGRNMSHGKIIVKGGLGENVIIGPLHNNSEVHLEGNGDFEKEGGEHFSGKIFQKGKLVYDGKDQ